MKAQSDPISADSLSWQLSVSVQAMCCQMHRVLLCLRPCRILQDPNSSSLRAGATLELSVQPQDVHGNAILPPAVPWAAWQQLNSPLQLTDAFTATASLQNGSLNVQLPLHLNVSGEAAALAASAQLMVTGNYTMQASTCGCGLIAATHKSA